MPNNYWTFFQKNNAKNKYSEIMPCDYENMKNIAVSQKYYFYWRVMYNPITGMCRLCLKESFFILFHPKTASLNKKTEIYQGCKHKMFKFLADCKVTWSPWRTARPNYYIFTFNIQFVRSKNLCSITNHDDVLVIADESMTKQICTITQKYKLWDNCFYLCKSKTSNI